MENQGIVLSREKILDALWGYDYYGDGRAVDTYIKRLRKRLGKYSNYIQTIVKTGYVWKGEEYFPNRFLKRLIYVSTARPSP